MKEKKSEKDSQREKETRKEKLKKTERIQICVKKKSRLLSSDPLHKHVSCTLASCKQ